MKASGSSEQSIFTRFWTLTCVAVLLMAWGLMTDNAVDDISMPFMLSLYGLTAIVSLMSAMLAIALARAGNKMGLYWLGMGALGSFILCLLPWLHFAGLLDQHNLTDNQFRWSWLLERVNTGIAISGFWLLQSRQRKQHQRQPGGRYLAWALVILAMALMMEISAVEYPVLSSTILSQPLELLAGIILFIPLAGLINQFRDQFSGFGYCVALSLVIGVCTQFSFMAFAQDILDRFTHIALILRLLSDIILFLGLCLQLLDRSRRQQQQLDDAIRMLNAAEPTSPSPEPDTAWQQPERVSQHILMSLMEDFHRAREQEAEAKQYVESILENLPLMVFVKDARELRFQRLNRIGEQLLGKSRNEMIGRNDYDFFDKEQADFFTDCDRKVLQEGRMLEIAEEAVTTPHGLRWLRTRKIPVKNANGEPQFMLGISEDITERRELEERFTMLFNAAPNGLVLLHPDGNIVLTNTAACNLFGYHEQELVDKPFSQLLPELPKDGRTIPSMEYLSGISLQRTAHLPNVTGRDRHGHGVPLDIALQPLPWRGDHYMLVSMVDSTERQKFISELEQANRTKSIFLASMSHELRTPMNSIIGFTEKVMRTADQLAPRHRDALETVRRNAHHLLNLINDILDLSKIEAGKMELNWESTDLRQFFELERTEYQQMVKKKKLTLEMDIPSQPVLVETDRGKLRQICHNLLSNAVKYTEQGTVTLRVNILQHPELGPVIELQVQDTGLGIRPEDQQVLFREFGRTNDVRKRNIQGTGLGLMITAQLVALLGGRISVDSQFGQGSTFIVLLPLQTPPTPT